MFTTLIMERRKQITELYEIWMKVIDKHIGCKDFKTISKQLNITVATIANISSNHQVIQVLQQNISLGVSPLLNY